MVAWGAVRARLLLPLGRKEKGGREPRLLQKDERARAAGTAQSCRTLAWVEQPASQWLSCGLQKSVSILAILDAFFTYEAQSEATENTCGITQDEIEVLSQDPQHCLCW